MQTCWVGSSGGMEQALVERAGIRYVGISTGQMRVMNPVKVFSSVGKMSAGVRQSLALIDEWRPDVCFVTGGYVCGPVAMACSMRKVPVIIYLPDITPGYAIRWLSKLAQRVAVSLPEVAQRFGGEAPQGKAVVTGYPVRQALVEAAKDRQLARRQLGEALHVTLDEPGSPAVPLLLVWGGSQGARAINRATWGAAAELAPHAQIVHVVGSRDWTLCEEWRKGNPLPPAWEHRYHAVAYLHEEMPLALAAADLTVARAGASTLGEFPVARLPAILAPYEGVNQMDNAQALARRGAAVIVTDEALPSKLAGTVIELLQNEPRRQAMEEAMASLARPHAALAIAQAIVALATRKV